jgi:hypothetical protein
VQYLLVRAQFEAAQVGRALVSCGGPYVGLVQWEFRTGGKVILGLERRFEELYREADLEMPFDMTCATGKGKMRSFRIFMQLRDSEATYRGTAIHQDCLLRLGEWLIHRMVSALCRIGLGSPALRR